ncbi:hypothetical protein B9G69_002125 [Bdellovibrio sp. SKB1291214]|uniref:hypothetical protein n=1 Tax=Bdellovibrio sp. SKB1291214 TaxID=1732569 RepID=UPI000B51E34A|nr:hypothetical protein [Bdellovibrio sp. SKB1291214]UYL09368.1 hypothetical protein B9G69_002125 [Bdellovibrio sp. SKB1291214]
MAPEMAAGYIFGIVPSLATTGAHYWFHKKKTTSLAFQQLQKNLATVQKYWCESQSRILHLEETSAAKDQEAFKTSLYVMGSLFAFMSWAGFMFNMIVLASTRKLAISRFEQKIFASDLCKKNLSRAEIEEILKDCEG